MDFKKYFVAPDIERAQTLPPAAFTSHEFLEREIESIFKKEWLAAPQLNAADLKLPGSRAPFEVLGHKLCAVRECHGLGLRCLSNICTHQGNQLVDHPEVGHDVFICGLHGRAFGLNGKCISHWPDWEPCASDDLKEYRMEWREIFPIINFSEKTEPETDIKDILSNLPLANAERADFAESERVLPGSWKLHARNFLDHTHIPTIHAESLYPKIDYGSYRTDILGNRAVQTVLAKDPAHAVNPAGHFAYWIFKWPNIAFNIYQFGLSVNVWEPAKNDPTKTRMRWACYVWDKNKYRQRDKIWGLADVDREDIEYVARMQRGAESGQMPRTKFSPKNEKATHWFERKIYEKIALA